MSEEIRFPVEDEQIAALLKGLDDGLQVPPEVTAAWKQAIRSESLKTENKKPKKQNILRWVGEIAAALLLLVGATLVWRSFGNSDITVPNTNVPAEKASEKYVFYTKTASVDSALPTVYDKDESASSRTAADKGYGVLEDNFEEASDDDMIIFTQSSDTVLEGMSDFEENETPTESGFVYIGKLDIYESDIPRAKAHLETIVNSVESAYIESEQTQLVSGSSTVSGTIRVRNEHLDELTEAIGNKFASSEIEINRINVTHDKSDLSDKLQNAYELKDRLDKEIEFAGTNADISLYEKLQELLDEINDYETAILKSEIDLEYATLNYTINGSEGKTAAVPATYGSRGFGGFMKDLGKVSMVMLPVIALTALITMHLSQRKRKKAQ